MESFILWKYSQVVKIIGDKRTTSLHKTQKKNVARLADRTRGLGRAMTQPKNSLPAACCGGHLLPAVAHRTTAALQKIAADFFSRRPPRVSVTSLVTNPRDDHAKSLPANAAASVSFT